jgi:hypothetical protein
MQRQAAGPFQVDQLGWLQKLARGGAVLDRPLAHGDHALVTQVTDSRSLLPPKGHRHTPKKSPEGV